MDDAAAWITTSTVLERLASGADEDAWGTFVRRFRGPLVGYGERRGLSASDAEDAAQEALAAFVEAFRAGRFERERGRLSHWLYGFVANAVRRALARTGAQDAQQLSHWSALEGAGEVDPEFEERWEREVLRQCLDSARAEFRGSTWRVFEALALEGRAVDEVAAETGLSRNAVYIAKHRVLARVEALIAECETPFANGAAPGALRDTPRDPARDPAR